MALPDISLAQFNRIASGEYNAGLVDLKTDDQGKLTGELAKVVMGTLFNGAARCSSVTSPVRAQVQRSSPAPQCSQTGASTRLVCRL